MEIYRKDSEYVVRIDLPGVNPNDVQVHTERNRPTITRERKTEEQVHDYPETCYDNFERTLTLPQGVEADEIVARYQHGVLEIRVPLSAKLAGRKIPIQIEQQANRKLEPKST
jgi:HSP20 family protein